MARPRGASGVGGGEGAELLPSGGVGWGKAPTSGQRAKANLGVDISFSRRMPVLTVLSLTSHSFCFVLPRLAVGDCLFRHFTSPLLGLSSSYGLCQVLENAGEGCVRRAREGRREEGLVRGKWEARAGYESTVGWYERMVGWLG